MNRGHIGLLPYRGSFLTRRVENEGYVSMQQHAGLVPLTQFEQIEAPRHKIVLFANVDQLRAFALILAVVESLERIAQRDGFRSDGSSSGGIIFHG